MPIVPASDSVTFKVTLPKSTVDELYAYADWAKAPRSRVLRIALERLFSDDHEWQIQQIDELAPEIPIDPSETTPVVVTNYSKNVAKHAILPPHIRRREQAAIK